MSGFDGLTKRTLQRTRVLLRNAESLSLDVGEAKFAPNHDCLSYWLSNSEEYVVIFVNPDGYLAEMWTIDRHGALVMNAYGIKNIRHFLSRLVKGGFQDITKDLGEIDLSFLESFGKDAFNSNDPDSDE